VSATAGSEHGRELASAEDFTSAASTGVQHTIGMAVKCWEQRASVLEPVVVVG
jgi:hypothetical protein